jgi:hypothetical protein
MTDRDTQALSDEKWLRDGSLIYTLRNGVNHCEIRVTMSDGSRTDAACGVMVEYIRALLSHTAPQAVSAKELAAIMREASDILGNFRPMRAPIVDELDGFALMLEDASPVSAPAVSEPAEQIIAEMREQANAYRIADSSVGMFADPETADLFDEFANRIAVLTRPDPADSAATCSKCNSPELCAEYGMACEHDAEPAAQSDSKDAIAWAVQKWNDEVANRPLVNAHRRTLDDTWRQVIVHFGGDDLALVGPRHDDLVAALAQQSGKEQGE